MSTTGTRDVAPRPASPVAAADTPGALRSPLVQRKTCACGGEVGPGGECASCRRKREAMVQRCANAAAGLDAGVPEVVREVLDTQGQPVERATQAFLGSRLGAIREMAAPAAVPARDAPGVDVDTAAEVEARGVAQRVARDDIPESRSGSHDFSRVRIHTGPRAEASARAIGAAAYTVGHHIVFGTGQYQPRTLAGQQLLAHELTHVIQQRALPAVAPRIMRSRCAHDGTEPRCGAGGLARWQLVDIATNEVSTVAIDDLIVNSGLARHFHGSWVTQVQTPPNPRKTGTLRGRADGMKVQTGSSLRVEVVEVKSRSTTNAGGCALATREAEGYVSVLRPLAPKVVEIANALAAAGGMRVAPGAAPNASQRLILVSAGIDLDDPVTLLAWRFYQSLQDRMNQTFAASITAFDAAVNTDGTPGTTYDATAVLMDCRSRRGRQGTKTRTLGFQVNGAGGVSYGCRDSECRTEEEERERQRQVQPVARPEEERDVRPETAPTREPVADDGAIEGDDSIGVPEVVPIVLVGAGAGLAAEAARRRARRIAGERAVRLAQEQAARAAAERAARRAAAGNVIDLAERRAARAAAQRTGASVATRAAGKAVVYAEVAAALILLVSGRAEARVGFGPSPLEALYDAMTRNGTPPSDEMRALLESDPTLQALAEQAAATGDASALQEATSRRILELIRDNPGAFSPEDLEILAQYTDASSGAAGGAPESAAELRAAIDQARTGAGGTGTDAGGATDRGGGGSAEPRAGEGGVDARMTQIAEAHPSLSPAVRGRLAAAPTPVRQLFQAMTTQKGEGPAVDDEAVRRFLDVTPIDLTAEEATALAAHVRPAAGQTLDEILGALETAIRDVRGGSREGEAAEAEAEGTVEFDPGGERSDSADTGDAEHDQAVRILRQAIDSYPGWGTLPHGSSMIVGQIAGKPVGEEVGVHVYYAVAAADGGTIRAAVFAHVRIRRSARSPGQRWAATVVSSTPLVADNGRVVAGLSSGARLEGVIQ